MRLLFFALYVVGCLACGVAYAQNPTAQNSGQGLNSPNVSLNSLFLYRNSNFANENQSVERNGLDLQELELAFYADVDPYSRLTLFLTVFPEYEADPTTDRVTQSYVVEPEEAFVESSRVPYVLLKIGKFKSALGKHNSLHTHAFPLIEAPLAQSLMLGDEGLNDVGASAAILIPTSWFSEITLQYLRGEGENEMFNSSTPSDGVYVARLKNLLDLTEDLTLELGVSGAGGSNQFGGDTNLLGADFTFKWRPSEGGKYSSIIFAGEWMKRELEDATSKEKNDGFNLWGQYQWSERWSTLARYDQTKTKDSIDLAARGNITTKKYSVNAIFNATEFSNFRFEYSQTEGALSVKGDSVERKILLQGGFTIGAHPSHAY